MEPFVRLEAKACPLPFENVDTDQLVPARFMSTPRSEGYDRFLLHDMRRLPNGDLNPELAINKPQFSGSKILVARRNFGCGSSREAAVYALVDNGFRCVVAPSFGEIFAGNALNNGLLTAAVAPQDADSLIAFLENGNRELFVDLDACTVRMSDSNSFAFRIDLAARKRLLNGWDDLDLTTSFASQVETWATTYCSLYPWVLPSGS